MNSIYHKAIVIVGLVLLVGGRASGQVPPGNDVSDAAKNTGGGSAALSINAGSFNTASGTAALISNTIGTQNTANGSSALFLNTSGSYNTASGHYALGENTTGFVSTPLLQERRIP